MVISRNSLDHVSKPAAVVREVHRLLRPGGHFILNVDVEHPASLTEPHELTEDDLRKWLRPFVIEREIVWDHSHAGESAENGHAVVIVARKPG